MTLDHIDELDELRPYVEAIAAFGVDTDFVSCLVNNEVWLEGERAGGNLYVVPRTPVAVPLGLTALISNVITFICDVPTMSLGRLDDPFPAPQWLLEEAPPEGPPRDLWRGHSPSESFRHDLYAAIEPAVDARWGFLRQAVIPWDPLRFGWPETDVDGYLAARVNLDGWREAEELLALYAASVRQVDPYSEYVLLYRVIENAAGGNGKEWVRSALPDLHTTSLGEIWSTETGMIGTRKVPDRLLPYVDQDRLVAPSRSVWQSRWPERLRENLMDLTELIRASARARHAVLRETLSNDQIATRLYNDLRCGIAHAHEAFLRHDSLNDLTEVLADLPLLRCLARQAIVATTPAASSLA